MIIQYIFYRYCKNKKRKIQELKLRDQESKRPRREREEKDSNS